MNNAVQRGKNWKHELAHHLACNFGRAVSLWRETRRDSFPTLGVPHSRSRVGAFRESDPLARREIQKSLNRFICNIRISHVIQCIVQRAKGQYQLDLSIGRLRVLVYAVTFEVRSFNSVKYSHNIRAERYLWSHDAKENEIFQFAREIAFFARFTCLNERLPCTNSHRYD